MDLKRAVLVGAVVWVMIFFEVCILKFGFNLGVSSAYYTWHYILSAIIFVIGGLIYFRKGKKNFEQGILAGLVFTAVGIALDALITVPLFVKDYNFFLGKFLWIGWVEGILVVSIVGALKNKQLI